MSVPEVNLSDSDKIEFLELCDFLKVKCACNNQPIGSGLYCKLCVDIVQNPEEPIFFVGNERFTIRTLIDYKFLNMLYSNYAYFGL